MLDLISGLVKLALLIVGAFTKTPEEKRNEFLNQLHSSLKKAKDEKDPSDLSKLINSL